MSRASSAVEYVPLISEERNTPTTASPREAGPSNASTSTLTAGWDDVGNAFEAASAR
jgi:hypothetical protein